MAPDNSFKPNALPETAICFTDVTVELAGLLIVDRVCASVPLGSSTAIIGPNGAGKTTLLLSILGEVPYSGKISFASSTKGAKKIGYVPQQIPLDRGSPTTVLELFSLGSQRLPLWLGLRRKTLIRAMELLEAVDVSHLAQRKLGKLSGGELQRVLLALALAQEPDILLLDEPTGSIDCGGEHVFCELLEDLRKQRGFTQLMVTHDLSMVTHHATHVICLNRTVVAEGPPAEVLTTQTLVNMFGLHMGLVNAHSLPDIPANCGSTCSHRGQDA